MSDVQTNPARVVQMQRDQVTLFPKCGGRGQLAGTAATLYTAPSGMTPTGATQSALLKSIILHNTDTVSRTVTIYLVESGGTTNAARQLYKFALAADETYEYPFADDCCPLDSGEMVRGLASSANVVTYRVNVVERY
jgi:hypothetical protein